eukprot:5748924-Prymnesium_polylepis.2
MGAAQSRAQSRSSCNAQLAVAPSSRMANARHAHSAARELLGLQHRPLQPPTACKRSSKATRRPHPR